MCSRCVILTINQLRLAKAFRPKRPSTQGNSMRKTVTGIALAVSVGIAIVGMSPLTASAANGTAAITGKVVAAAPYAVGTSNGPRLLAKITVKAKSLDGDIYATHTNSKGAFYLKGLKAGTYSLKFVDTVGHTQCDGGCGKTKYFTSEWLGDSTTFAAADTITVEAGDKHTGVRAQIGERSRLTGTVTIDGKPVKGTDVRMRAESISSDKQYSLVPSPAFYFDLAKGNYRIKVYSASKAFTSFYVTDEEDGNTVFHANGVDKRTGVKVDITTD